MSLVTSLTSRHSAPPPSPPSRPLRVFLHLSWIDCLKYPTPSFPVLCLLIGPFAFSVSKVAGVFICHQRSLVNTSRIWSKITRMLPLVETSTLPVPSPCSFFSLSLSPSFSLYTPKEEVFLRTWGCSFTKTSAWSPGTARGGSVVPLHPPLGCEVLGRRSLHPALLEREPVSAAV